MNARNAVPTKLTFRLLLALTFLILGVGAVRLSGQDGDPEKTTIFLQEFIFQAPQPGGSCSGNERITAPSGLPNVEDFVELRRSRCYGRCPAYTVRVRADGKVTWNGRAYVGKVGEDTATILPAQARALIEKFRTNDVWSLCSDYSRAVTDSVTETTTMRIGNMEMEISDYANSAPAWFRNLRDEIDSVAGTRRWIERDPRTEVFDLVPPRDAQGRSPDHSALPIIGLINATIERPSITPLMRASIHGDLTTAESLIAGKADVNARDAGGWTALMYAAGSEMDGNSIIQKLLEAGADPNARTAMGQTPVMAAVQASDHLKERVRMLQQAGADINAQDSNGQTALMFASENILGIDSREAIFKELMENLTMLRTIGARADIRDKWGRTVFDQIEDEAKGRVGSGKEYGFITRILRDLIPGDFGPVNVTGRVIAPHVGDVAVTAVAIDRVGAGFESEKSQLSADGTFKFSNLKQGVYTLRLEPSPTINPTEIAVSVTDADLSNIEIVNPGMHEVRIFVENLSPTTIGMILENSIIGPAIGKPPEITVNDYDRRFPTNILSAIATHGLSSNVQLVKLAPDGLNNFVPGLYLPEPFTEQKVPNLEQVSNDAFRIVLPAGEYQVGVLVPISNAPLVVESITSGSTDLSSQPLKIPNNDSKAIHIRLKRN